MTPTVVQIVSYSCSRLAAWCSRGEKTGFYLSVDRHLLKFLSLAMMISVAINMIGKNLCILTSDLLGM